MLPVVGTRGTEQTLYGCSLIVLNKYGTPHIKYFDNETIRDLARGDRRGPRQTGEPFGHAEFRSRTETCYVIAPERPVPEVFNIYVPHIKHLIGNKLKCLPSQHRPMFESMFDAYDKNVDKYCASLQ